MNEEKIKVLFLDCDGVLNSEDGFTSGKISMKVDFPVDAYMAFLVGKIELETGCKVVLSSTWRHHPPSVDELNKRIVPIHDMTGNSWYDRENDHHSTRGEEIKKWLDAHPEVEKYAILDDDNDMLPGQLPNFFKTSWKEGLTEEIALKIIEHLK